MSPSVDAPLNIALGIGLAATAGFLVFVPLLCVSIAALSGSIELSEGFRWMGTEAALLTFGVATLVEVLAYYLPWVDHLLDALATPLALVAGTISAAAVITGAPPLFRWSIAVIAGGGVAGMVQGATVIARLKSTLFTGGLGNFVIASLELLGAVLLGLLSLAAPLAAVALVGALLFLVFRATGRLFFGRPRKRHFGEAPRPPAPPDLPRHHLPRQGSSAAGTRQEAP